VTISIDASSGAGVCSLSGATLTYLKAGTCVVVAQQTGDQAYTAASPETRSIAVTLHSFAPGPVASITGTPRVGSVLTGHRGSVSPTPDFVDYRWFADGASISGATRKTFTLTAAQAGKKITVKATLRKAGYTTVSDTSDATARISVAQAKELLLDPDEDTVRRGQRVDVEIRRLFGGEGWTLYFDKIKVGSGRADSRGRVNTTYTVPANATLGKHVLRVTGKFPDRTDTDKLEVKK
jgi:hypothetical protein